MKKLIKLAAVIAAMAMALSFVACDDDDDDDDDTDTTVSSGSSSSDSSSSDSSSSDSVIETGSYSYTAEDGDEIASADDIAACISAGYSVKIEVDTSDLDYVIFYDGSNWSTETGNITCSSSNSITLVYDADDSAGVVTDDGGTWTDSTTLSSWKSTGIYIALYGSSWSSYSGSVSYTIYISE